MQPQQQQSDLKQEDLILIGLTAVVRHGTTVEDMEGKTYQVHVKNDKLTLYEVKLDFGKKCPVIVGGERCGRELGHSGKHAWAGGD